MHAVTLAQVAQSVGVSVSTVSRALKGSPKISVARRTEILEAANRLGYAPDPRASSLAEGRWRGDRRAKSVAWAYLCGAPAHLKSTLKPRLEECAARAGYQLCHIHLRPQTSGRALARELRAKGVEGILIGRAGLCCFDDWASFPSEQFAWVGLDPEHSEPAVHRVMFNVFREVQDALAAIASRGYRRIAYIASEENWARVAMRQQAAIGYFAEMNLQLRVSVVSFKAFGDVGVRKRLRDEVDMLLFAFVGARDAVGPELAGMPFASLGIWPWCSPEVAGMELAEEEYCRAAVDLLDFQYRRGAFGFPQFRHSIMVDCRWRDGASLPPCGPIA